MAVNVPSKKIRVGGDKREGGGSRDRFIIRGQRGGNLPAGASCPAQKRRGGKKEKKKQT